MANTINNGISQSLAYYPATGTDIDDAGANLKWDPATNQVTLLGRLQVSKNVASTTDTTLSLLHYGSNFVPIYIGRSLGTTTTPAKVITGYTLGGISFIGRADTVFKTGAYINAVVDGAVSDTSMPSKIVFGTHNGSALTTRAELSKLGELKVNTIKDFSGGILTLNPATKLDLGAASKISISGGSAGQVLSLNTAGVLEWTTITTTGTVSDSTIRNAINAGTGIAFNKATGFITNAISSTDLLAEGTNRLYYTDARVRSAISVSGSLSYNNLTGVISYTTPTTIASLNNHTTSVLAEGTNLYFTNARARSAISVTDAGGDGSMNYDSSTGVFTYNGPSASEVRSKISLVDAGGDGSMNYNSSTGVFTYTGPSASEVRSKISLVSNTSSGELTYDSSSGIISSGLSFSNFGLQLKTNSLTNYIDFGHLTENMPGISIGKEKNGVNQFRNSHMYITENITETLSRPAHYSSDDKFPNWDYVSWESNFNGIPNNTITIDNLSKIIFVIGGTKPYRSKYLPSYDIDTLYHNMLSSTEEFFLILSVPDFASAPTSPQDYDDIVITHTKSDPIAIYKVNSVINDGNYSITGLPYAYGSGTRTRTFNKQKLQVNVTFVGCSNIGINDGIPDKFYLLDLIYPGYNCGAEGISFTWKKSSELSASIRGALRLDNCAMGNGKIVFPDNTVQTTAYQVVTAPTTATSSGITGQIAYDSNYVYICTATNTWKRSALSSW